MTEERHAELMELGQRAAAISGFWESSEGCLTFPEAPGGRQYRVTYVRYCDLLHRDIVGMIEADQDYPVKIGYDGSHPGDLRDHVPDLSDRATVAHLLSLVRGKWGPFAVVVPVQNDRLPNGVKWVLMVGSSQPGIEGATEVETLLAALEANND